MSEPGRQTAELQPGSELGKYILSKRLARGGMGEVWLASLRGTSGFRKNMVLKTILPEYAASPGFVALFKEEALLTAQLRHPNLIDVYDFDFAQGFHYIVMEYLEGWSLSQILNIAAKKNRRIPEWFILRIAEACCRGLDHAHNHSGILHCDLSPGNVMVSTAGHTKVVDFGVARPVHAQGGSLHNGKLSYLAPERLVNRGVDVRSDVYSLGVLMYLLFTNRLPFRGDDRAVARAILKGEATPPHELCLMDPASETILLRALATDPAERYQSVGKMGDAIRRLRARLPHLDPFIKTSDYLAGLWNAREDRASVEMLSSIPHWRIQSDVGSEPSELSMELSLEELEIVEIAPIPVMPIVEVRPADVNEESAGFTPRARERRLRSETSIQRLFQPNELGSSRSSASTASSNLSGGPTIFQPTTTPHSSAKATPFGGALLRDRPTKRWPWAGALRKPR